MSVQHTQWFTGKTYLAPCCGNPALIATNGREEWAHCSFCMKAYPDLKAKKKPGHATRQPGKQTRERDSSVRVKR